MQNFTPANMKGWTYLRTIFSGPKIPVCKLYAQKTKFSYPWCSAARAQCAQELHYDNIACEQGLCGALAAGREKKGELATTSLEFEFYLQFPRVSPLTELTDFDLSARSGNERECKQTLKNTCRRNDFITNVISANQLLHRLFRCRNSNSRDVVASSLPFFRPAATAPWRACSRANDNEFKTKENKI